MKTITGTYNKAVTLILTKIEVVNGEIKERGTAVEMFRKKSDFFKFAESQEAMKIVVAQNLGGFIKKMGSIGFSCEVDEEYGFEWEAQVYCSK